MNRESKITRNLKKASIMKDRGQIKQIGKHSLEETETLQGEKNSFKQPVISKNKKRTQN